MKPSPTTAASPAEHPRERELASRSKSVAAVTAACTVLAGLLLAVTGVGGPGWGMWTAIVAIALSGLWVSYTDHVAHLILNVTTATLGASVLLIAQFSVVMGWASLAELVRAVVATLVVAVVYLVLVVLNASSPGDLKLAAVLALPLGLAGWPVLVAGVILPYLLSWPEALVKWRKGERKDRLAFGPYLIVGAVLALLWATAR